MTAPDDRAILLHLLHRGGRRLPRGGWPAAACHVWDDLIDLAARQRVRPLLHRAVAGSGLDEHIPVRVRQAVALAYRETALRNLRLCAELAKVARDLGARDVPVLVLKGAHLVADLYHDVGLREMNDLDVLVQVEHLPTAVEVLREHGYQALRPSTIEPMWQRRIT